MSLTSHHSDARSYRLSNIDMLRGLVIVIMALDHVRDYFLVTTVQDPISDPETSLGLYLTRWVTHFCAPVFVFLAGTSAGLMADRKSHMQLAGFLATRGLWLIAVELIIISTAWSFAQLDGIPEIGGKIPLIFQVIWAIGASMVLLALAQFGGARFCLVLGTVIVVGHNALDPAWPLGQLLGGGDPLWYALHTQSSTVVGPFLLVFVYPLLPWVGVMFLGYGTAYIFKLPARQSDAYLLRAGVIMVVGFFLLRTLDIYGDPNPWSTSDAGIQATVFDFMNVTKYPPSLIYLLATLGPMAIACAFACRWQGKLKDIFIVFGRAPFAFYVLHLYLIHLLSVLYGLYQGYGLDETMTIFFFYPDGFGVTLPWVYLFWLLIVAALYPVCHWMVELKSRRKDWWLSYL
ncbi:MAG: heparan-alpha-glucosaminide N-acetyltransferase domain-containing protein [Halioglobus sp.]